LEEFSKSRSNDKIVAVRVADDEATIEGGVWLALMDGKAEVLAKDELARSSLQRAASVVGTGVRLRPAITVSALASRQDRTVAPAVWPGAGALNLRGRIRLQLGPVPIDRTRASGLSEALQAMRPGAAMPVWTCRPFANAQALLCPAAGLSQTLTYIPFAQARGQALLY
jgi:hypothetical protein